MKMLVIGMDGAQESTFKRGWTPYIESLIEKGQSLQLKEDLISRGWAEIMTGQHAINTGMLYEQPIADGTHAWTEKCKLNNIPGIGLSVKPVWDVVSELGFRVGVMNVPTTYPAPKVDGFFVSGGGGGGPVTQDINMEQCYPKSIKNILSDDGYIVDERLVSLLSEKKLYKPAQFFSRLQEMNEKRTQSFIDLSKGNNIDFGFLVYRSTVTAETFLLPQIDLFKERKNNLEGCFFEAAESFYRHFDEQVKMLVNTFPDAKVVLVSDHSMTTRNWSVNSNAFLVDSGFQEKSASRRGAFDFVKSFKHWIPHFIRQKMKNNPNIRTAYESMITFDPKTSRAFSMAFSTGAHGIYINDKVRFGGPVKFEEKEWLIAEIIRQFNEFPESIKHGFKAHRKPDIKSECIDAFPDIILELPDGYLTTNEYPDFIKKHSLPDLLYDFTTVEKTGNYCIKGRQPLAVNVDGPWNVVPTSESQDLRGVYDHVVSYFNSI